MKTGDMVRAMTLEYAADDDPDGPEESIEVTGTLTIRHVDMLDYDQYLVDGVLVEPDSIEPLTYPAANGPLV